MGVELDFQAALYTRLADQIIGGGKPCLAVYDPAPQESAFPYVTFGETNFQIFDAHGSFNFDVLVRLNTWSRTGSPVEVKTIQGNIYSALHDYDLTLTRFGGAGEVDWLCYSLLRESSAVMIDPDQVFHGVCEYRALIQSA